MAKALILIFKVPLMQSEIRSLLPGLVTLARHLYPPWRRHLYFLLLAQKKVPKKKAVFPAAPTTCGDCAVFDRYGCVFCSIPSFFVLSKKALPPASGPSPSVGRASQTARQSQWWVCGRSWCHSPLPRPRTSAPGY